MLPLFFQQPFFVPQIHGASAEFLALWIGCVRRFRVANGNLCVKPDETLIASLNGLEFFWTHGA